MSDRAYLRTRAQLWADRVLAGVVLVIFALFFFLLATTWSSKPTPACAPVDYHDGAWHNPEGAVVAVSPTEDGILHYIGECK